MINPYPYTWNADLVEIEIEPYGERTQSTYLGTAVFLVSTANPFVVLETNGYSYSRRISRSSGQENHDAQKGTVVDCSID